MSAQDDTIRRAWQVARTELLSQANASGFWTGELSPSALSTATAASALSLVGRDRFAELIEGALRWLIAHQNADGGWGDTPNSPSNISTTMLVQAALKLSDVSAQTAWDRSERYLAVTAGTSPEARLGALRARYGKDRTFAVPILTNCALAGVPPFGAGGADWQQIPPLPFELACCPTSWLSATRLHVVSYALPALIAIGQLLHVKHPTRNLPVRFLRNVTIGPALKKLIAIQPASGGFIEATPLTSFVVMSLAGASRLDHPVVRKGVDFLVNSVRPDGSWPIDTNLSVWVTTQAMTALAQGPEPVDLSASQRWLLARQQTHRHPYTGTRPGGWAWTELSGGVPDADDTSGALMALALAKSLTPEPAIRNGLHWLLELQNRDGGWPTFCRGWGKLPFDRSAPDLTAHALRALAAWPQVRPRQALRARERALRYLAGSQRPDGSWLPLWFGNQHTAGETNPVYGTAKVLSAYTKLGLTETPEARRGVGFLLGAQCAEGGWSGGAGAPATIEETALACEALWAWSGDPLVSSRCLAGARRLAGWILEGGLAEPAPIGLYFANLWYWEKLYPVIWSVGALGRVLPRSKT